MPKQEHSETNLSESIGLALESLPEGSVSLCPKEGPSPLVVLLKNRKGQVRTCVAQCWVTWRTVARASLYRLTWGYVGCGAQAPCHVSLTVTRASAFGGPCSRLLRAPHTVAELRQESCFLIPGYMAPCCLRHGFACTSWSSRLFRMQGH